MGDETEGNRGKAKIVAGNVISSKLIQCLGSWRYLIIVRPSLFHQSTPGVTESAVANLVNERGGRFYAPPVSSGLLPGVFRGHLLRKGIIRERVLRKTDLTRADRIFLINSVRRWIPAQFLSG
jgi:para-aminobenzoate synthetase/4-amino-4-deoxychorismate lyase